MKSIRMIAGALLALALTAVAQAPDSLLHQPAPEFARPDLNHRHIDLTAYRGRVVLLNFWATWCAPCQVEMPRFVEWQRRYGGQGLQVLGVSMDDDAAPVAAFVRKRHVNYPVVMGDAELGRLYGGVLGLPATFLIDRDGRIEARYKGETDLAAMEREVRRLLAAKPD